MVKDTVKLLQAPLSLIVIATQKGELDYLKVTEVMDNNAENVTGTMVEIQRTGRSGLSTTTTQVKAGESIADLQARAITTGMLLCFADLYIDLIAENADPDGEVLPRQVMEPVKEEYTAPDPTVTTEQAKGRTRRTKAQIEADEAAKAQQAGEPAEYVKEVDNVGQDPTQATPAKEDFDPLVYYKNVFSGLVEKNTPEDVFKKFDETAAGIVKDYKGDLLNQVTSVAIGEVLPLVKDIPTAQEVGKLLVRYKESLGGRFDQAKADLMIFAGKAGLEFVDRQFRKKATEDPDADLPF